MDKLSTLPHVVIMFSPTLWKQFIADFEAKQKGLPVLASIVKKTTFLENKDDTTLVVDCPNNGVRMYLETKREIVESALSGFVKFPVTIVFLVTEKRRVEKKGGAASLVFNELKRPKTEEVKPRVFGVVERFSFDNFAVSSSNQIAYAAAHAVAERPGDAYNPLFIYGGVGVGKTHLCHAIPNKALQTNSSLSVLLCTAEDFTNDLVVSIQEKNTQKFRKKYRSFDILVVDDVQFIAGKTYVQEEFYHTFNSIVRQGGQIVLSSDRPPSEIKKLEDRLRSRFSGGLIIDVQKPDFELRTAIVLIKAKERNIPLDIEVARLIAEKTSDARELEGRLLSFLAVAAHQGRQITTAVVTEEIEKNTHQERERVGAHELIRLVCTYYNLPAALLRGPSRKESVVFPRQVTMYLLRSFLRLTLEEIALVLKKKDHTTIMHGVDKITALIMKNAPVKQDIENIKKQIGFST